MTDERPMDRGEWWARWTGAWERLNLAVTLLFLCLGLYINRVYIVVLPMTLLQLVLAISTIRKLRKLYRMDRMP